MTKSTIAADLYSDTITRSTPEMRRFMCRWTRSRHSRIQD